MGLLDGEEVKRKGMMERNLMTLTNQGGFKISCTS